MTAASFLPGEFIATARPKHPYPGLRPFDFDEWSIFFGREQMIDDVIGRLAEHRLVLIHGSSGSGKSSLVRAGVLPKLARQHLRHGMSWQICIIRPSGGPLWNLAKEFARIEGCENDIKRIGEILGEFNRPDQTLASIAGSLKNLKGRRLCILIDQFEELFWYEKKSSREEAELFVDLLVRSTAQADPESEDAESDRREPAADGDAVAAVHIVVTMRSEFLGECARFAGLAEAINRTQYLVPGMDREALLRAISKPALLYGGEVSIDLAERLIANASGREDQLPLIQHGLMYFWDDAAKQKSGDKIVLDAAPLENAGGLVNLLSNHANAIVTDVAPDGERKFAVERLFRALTELNAEGHAIRRPQLFRDLVTLTKIAPDKLRAIIDAFRAEGASFLTPYSPQKIGDGTQIDISHEALIRCWHQLSDSHEGWLKREFDDGLIWRSLLVEASGFERNPEHVLSPATTAERWNWWQQRKLNEHWAERYGGHFRLVEKLMRASRDNVERIRAEVARRDLVRRRWLLASLAASVVLLFTASVAVWKWNATQVAEKRLAESYDKLDRENDRFEATINALVAHFEGELKGVIGTTAVELDSRKETVRTQEAAIGNLFADIIRERIGADAAMINGGSIRGNKRYPAGSQLTFGDIFVGEFSYANRFALIEVSGKMLRAAVENGLSKLPNADGRFPQVSNLVIEADARLKVGERVLSIKVGDAPLQDGKSYRIATNDYMVSPENKDGYVDTFGQAKQLNPGRDLPFMAIVVIDYIKRHGTIRTGVEGRIVLK